MTCVNWVDFAEGLYKWFGEKTMTDVIEEFNKLKQEGAVVECQVKFEELRLIVCIVQPGLTEQYLVSTFISVLREELHSMVKMMISTFAEKAQLQELTMEAIFRRHKVPYRPGVMVGQLTGGNHRPCLRGLIK